MANPYEGKWMRIEMQNGSEAIGRFLKADNHTKVVTFTDVRWVKDQGGLTGGFDRERVSPMEQFPSDVLGGLAVVEDPSLPQESAAVPASNAEVSHPVPTSDTGAMLTAQKTSAWGRPTTYRDNAGWKDPPSTQQPQAQQYHQSNQQEVSNPYNPPSSQDYTAPPTQPVQRSAWGRGRGASAGQNVQPPARAPQPAPTAGSAPAGQAASTWARAVGGGGRGGAGGAKVSRGRGGRGRGGRAWTPGVPKGDSRAAAVADDFDFAANNRTFEAEKPNLLAELGLDDPADTENDRVPPGQRKPQFEDDFFDNISHTLHEKIGIVEPLPRPGLKEQREINMETFGAASVPRSAYPRGPNRSYGGANGGGGGRSSSNVYAYNGSAASGAGGGGRQDYAGAGGRGYGRGRGGNRDGAGRWNRGGRDGGSQGSWGRRGGRAGGRGVARGGNVRVNG